MVRLHRRVAGLAVRHDGPAALQPGPHLGGPQPAGRRGRRCPARRVRRLVRRRRDHDLHDRLGPGRILLRRARRSHRPGEDDVIDRLVLFGIHRTERPFDRGLGFRRLSLSDGAGRGRAVCRRRRAGGRGHAGPVAAVCAGLAAGAFGGRQHAGCVYQSRAGLARGGGEDRQLLANHVRHRPGAGLAGDSDLSAAQGTRALESRGQRGGAARRRASTGWARWPSCSATRAGGGTRSSA